MMKSIVVIVFIVFLSTFGMAQNYCGGSIKGGDGIPWPFGFESRFPIRALQGVWQTVTGDCNNQFVFRVTESDGERIVKIWQYDPVACRVVGTGLGFLNDKIIVAQMTKKGVTYNMTIHVYKEDDLAGSLVCAKNQPDLFAHDGLSSGKYVVVISLYPVGRWEERATYQISKFDSSTNMICK